MTAAPARFGLFVGVDIAAASFAASWTTATTPAHTALTCAQSPDGFRAFQDRLRVTAIPPVQTLVVLEATSSDWVALAVTLHQAGFVVRVVNPAKVHT
jgi:transposase